MSEVLNTSKKEFERESKGKRPVLAICYDFDKTLSPDDMQAQGYIHNAVTNDKSKVYKMMHDGRIKYYAPADYSEGTELDNLVKSIINRTAANEALEDIYYQCKKENFEADKQNSEEGRKKTDLLITLESSKSFATTHSTLSKPA